ncbi:MAG TPA: spore germination protein GerW family protein [Pirellulales bacterium]|nr:spore germination protein GerW family protein [Pirellulales bacterium]
MLDDAIDQTTKKQKPTFVERIVERMGLQATAKAVYADPVERDGITVIPVAKLRWGFGGGSGRKRGKRGKGGGGGMQAAPLGYIEITEGRTQFKPIHDPMTLVPIAAVGGIVGWILLRSLRKLFRG